MRSLRSFFSVCFIGLVFSACGGSTTGAGSNANAAQACAGSAKARCEKRDACTNGVANKVRFGDEPTCEARDQDNCNAALDAPSTSTTPDSVTACGSSITAQTCSEFLAGTTTSACEPTAGKIANGAACLYGAQCQSTYCAVPIGAACGTCAPLPKVGDSCAVTGNCGRDLVCTRDTSVCVVPVGLNGACGRGAPCEPTLGCVGATTLRMGTCQARASTVGAACDPLERTAPSCESALGLYCDATSGTCKDVGFATTGQTCGATATGEVVCTGGASCQRPSGSRTGTCVAPAADGAPCDPTNGPDCLSPARCITTSSGASGTCKLPDATACH